MDCNISHATLSDNTVKSSVGKGEESACPVRSIGQYMSNNEALLQGEFNEEQTKSTYFREIKSELGPSWS